MGNCLENQSTAAQDWTSPAPTDYPRKPSGERNGGGASTEVKIKITKKQLEELLGKTKVQGLTVQQLIAQWIQVNNGFQSHHQVSWKPALQSIPETTYDDDDDQYL